MIPIATGGGGIPVGRRADGTLYGLPAVVDKDHTSALLANSLNADRFMMFTGVEQVALDFGKPTARAIDHMTAAEARAHLAAGQFPPGSMGPKIAAALRYLERGGKAVTITSIDRAAAALVGRAGTTITAR